MLRAAISFLIAILALGSARAAVMTADYVQLDVTTWTLELQVVNDGAPAEITGFTVWFDETVFANLAVSASPAAWDSIVIQPDTTLESAGFFDSVLIDPGQPLVFGERQGGFRVEFTFLGAGSPPMLPFEIVDLDFNVLYSGTTTPIPEPRAALLMLMGLAWVVRRTALVREPAALH